MLIVLYTLNTCALCGEKKEIKLSHIIPKLVGRNLKKTSIGAIRNTENPNKVVQDTEKHYLLCDDCEERFSASETWFANKIYYPYVKRKSDDFDYDERLHYFLISLSWRSLYLDIMDLVQNGGCQLDTLNHLIKSEAIMKDYLLEKRSDVDYIENHIFFFDTIKSVSGELGENINELQPHISIHRGITSYTVWYEEPGTFFTFTNMMGIIVITFYMKNEAEKWINTKIKNGRGNIKAKNQTVKSVVSYEIQYLMEMLEKAKKNLDIKQIEKIEKKFLSVGDKIKDYDIFKDILDDRNIRNNL